MSGVCSKHRGHDPACRLCTAIPTEDPMSGEFAIPKCDATDCKARREFVCQCATCAQKADGDLAERARACDAHRDKVSEAHAYVYGVRASWLRAGP